MPLSPRLRRRLLAHHLVLALTCAAALGLVAMQLLEGRAEYRWSMATAYVGLALLAVTLSLGAWQLLSAGRAPVSSDLRRDFGIWAALLSLAHVAAGLQVHMKSMVLYFFVPSAGGLWLPRVDAFGLANWAGLAATLVLVLLLCLSNDWSLRRLGHIRWKALQRCAYAAAVLVVLHGAVYQLLERRQLAWVLVFGLIVVAMAVAQSWGFRRRRAHSP